MLRKYLLSELLGQFSLPLPKTACSLGLFQLLLEGRCPRWTPEMCAELRERGRLLINHSPLSVSLLRSLIRGLDW